MVTLVLAGLMLVTLLVPLGMLATKLSLLAALLLAGLVLLWAV